MFLGVRCQHVGSDLWHWHPNESWHFLKTLPQQRAAHPWSSFTMRRMCTTDTQQTQTDTQWRFSVTGTIWCFKGFRACLKKFPAIISLYLIISLFSPVHSFCSLYIYIYPSAEDTLCFLMANVKLWVDRFPPPWSAAISKADLEASRREETGHISTTLKTNNPAVRNVMWGSTSEQPPLRTLTWSQWQSFIPSSSSRVRRNSCRSSDPKQPCPTGKNLYRRWSHGPKGTYCPHKSFQNCWLQQSSI